MALVRSAFCRSCIVILNSQSSDDNLKCPLSYFNLQNNGGTLMTSVKYSFPGSIQLRMKIIGGRFCRGFYF